jgi:hypothetical protein
MEEEIRVATEIQNSSDTPTHSFLGIDLSTEFECFGAKNRKRTFTAIFAASGQQMIGATFVIGYATYFLQLIHVKDYFDASVVLYIVMLLSSIAAFPLTEILGRRTLIVWPQFALCFMLLVIGILGCVPDQTKASWGILVFIYLWAIIFQLSIGATGFVLASEIATMRLRGATQGLVTITNAVWGLIMQFTIPYMVRGDMYPSRYISDHFIRSIPMQEVWVGRSASSFWGRGLLLQLGDGSYIRKQRYDFSYKT